MKIKKKNHVQMCLASNLIQRKINTSILHVRLYYYLFACFIVVLLVSSGVMYNKDNIFRLA